MTRQVLLVALWVMLSGVPASIARTQDQACDFSETRMAANSHPHFSCLVDVLQQVVDHRGRHGRHTLFLSPVNAFGPTQFIRVYWPRDASILVVPLDGHGCRQHGTELDAWDWDWFARNGRIDLKSGVVPTNEDIGSSSYLVSRPWVNAVIDDCKRRGHKLIVHRSARLLNPRIRVLARASYLRDVPALRAAGADNVYSGEGEVALAFVEDILEKLGATPEQIDRERERAHRELSPGL